MPFSEHMDALVGPTDATLNLRVQSSPAKSTTSKSIAFPHYVGRYRALEMIARGGMGVVLRAYDATLDREVALKMLSPEIEPDSETGKRFADEARVASQLNHAGIIPIYDAGELADGRPYFTMPFIRGQSLAMHLSKRQDLRDGLKRWLGVFQKLCHVVAHAHQQGIVHRDLKPGNVMLGDTGEVIVMDWGLAATDRPNHSNPASGYWVYGTPAYMPPEQANGEFSTDPRTDVFGLGAILCEILTGQPPYVGVDVSEVTRMAIAGNQAETEDRLRDSPANASLALLVRRCLATDRNDRPANAAEVASAIGSIHARKTHWHRRITVFRREHLQRFRAVAMAALALIAAAVIGALTAREIHAGSPRMVSPLTPNSAPSASP